MILTNLVRTNQGASQELSDETGLFRTKLMLFRTKGLIDSSQQVVYRRITTQDYIKRPCIHLHACVFGESPPKGCTPWVAMMLREKI
jgi:hypothetical protein